MAASNTDLAPAALNDEGKADLARWIELDRQHKQLTEQLQSCNGPRHELSRRLELLWHEKALLADRLLSALAPQWVGEDDSLGPNDDFELPPAVCYLKARPEPERLDDGSPCQHCGTVDEDKPRQWVHNKLTGHKYLCPSCEDDLPDCNDPEVFAKAIRELDL